MSNRRSLEQAKYAKSLESYNKNKQGQNMGEESSTYIGPNRKKSFWDKIKAFFQK